MWSKSGRKQNDMYQTACRCPRSGSHVPMERGRIPVATAGSKLMRFPNIPPHCVVGGRGALWQSAHTVQRRGPQELVGNPFSKLWVAMLAQGDWALAHHSLPSAAKCSGRVFSVCPHLQPCLLHASCWLPRACLARE
eukprot:3987657-Alexandrium_andersonii.AAC.1